MKIKEAWVDDPTTRGELLRPEVCVEVDELPDVTIQPVNFAGGWIVGKFGPFVKYSAPDQVDAGDFNVRFRNRFPVVVDITLFCDDEQYAGYSLPLTRARQLIRRHDNSWRLVVSDRDAETGSLLWVPVQYNPTCRSWLGNRCCGKTPARFIRVSGIDFAMCEEHVQENNQRHAAKRVAAAPKAS